MLADARPVSRRHAPILNALLEAVLLRRRSVPSDPGEVLLRCGAQFVRDAESVHLITGPAEHVDMTWRDIVGTHRETLVFIPYGWSDGRFQASFWSKMVVYPPLSKIPHGPGGEVVQAKGG